MVTAASQSPPHAASQVDRQSLNAALDAISGVVRGNRDAVRLLLAAVLARGHVLLEDVPGVGKTTLARTVARALGCSFSRIQFTADLLPSDLLGMQILDRERGELAFRRGPVFANLVLADEINRASPKTQSALLEAMSDRQVTVDDATYALEPPFSVIATQNPIEHHGAYPLPESQLDRFMVRLSLGYPPEADELSLLMADGGADRDFASVRAALDPERICALQSAAAAVKVAEPVAGYLLAIATATRERPEVLLGCSPRGTLAWMNLCRAQAFLEGRDYVLPDDVKALAEPVLCHRIVVRGAAEGAGGRAQSAAVVDAILAETPVPR